jgi:translocation protein SEC66
LKAALVRRAIADVQRILRIREDKPALQNLLQKGSVGDDLWNSLLAAEKELEAEIVEVHAEANTFVEGWGQVLFQTASEMLANEKTRAIVEQMPLERARNGIHSISLTRAFCVVDQSPEVKYGKRTPGDKKPATLASTPTGPTIPKPSTSPKSSTTLAPPTPSAGADGISSEGEASPRIPRVSATLFDINRSQGSHCKLSSLPKSRRSENNSYSTVFMCTSLFCAVNPSHNLYTGVKRHDTVLWQG